MSKKLGIIVSILSVIALVVSVFSLVTATKASTKKQADDQDIQYVMYLGTNDKDTNEPVFSPDEAKSKAEDILIKNFGGYTIQEANGGWIDDGKKYREYTLVIYLSDTDLASVHKAANDLIKEFNQSSVLIQTNETKTEFYSLGE